MSSKSRTRKDPTERKAELLAAGVELAQKVGVANVTRREVARMTETTDGLVTRYFGDAAGLRKAVEKVVKRDKLTVPDKKAAAEIGKGLRARSKPPEPARKKKPSDGPSAPMSL